MLPNMATNGNNFQAKLATKNLSENCYSKWSYKNKIQIILKTKIITVNILATNGTKTSKYMRINKYC